MAHEIELQIFELVKLHLQLMERIALALESMASAQAPQRAPNYELPLERWKNFDWASIGARVERSDSFGPAIISWRGIQFARRSPANKYQEAIWFSRCIGKDERGENQYERLATFKPLSAVEPVPERVSRLIR